MAWFRKRKEDNVAWYRHQNYKGDLSEELKRELDSIRWPAEPGPHPAAKFQDLPEEVQEYIVHLEFEVEDSKSFPPVISIIVGISYIICIDWDRDSRVSKSSKDLGKKRYGCTIYDKLGA